MKNQSPSISLLFVFLFFGFSVTSQDTVRLCAVPVHNGAFTELQIQAENFNNVISMQFAAAWEDSQFSMDSVGNFNETLQAVGLIQYNPETFNVPNNIELMRSLWYDQSLQGVNLEDGEVIYSVYLQNAFPGQNGFFGIVEDVNFPIELVDGNNEILEVDVTSAGCLSFRFGDLTSSVEDLAENTVSVVNNPSSGWIALKGELESLSSIDIFDLSGKHILRLENSFTKGMIDLSFLTNGTYILSFLSAENSQIGVQKLVIQK